MPIENNVPLVPLYPSSTSKAVSSSLFQEFQKDPAQVIDQLSVILKKDLASAERPLSAWSIMRSLRTLKPEECRQICDHIFNAYKQKHGIDMRTAVPAGKVSLSLEKDRLDSAPLEKYLPEKDLLEKKLVDKIFLGGKADDEYSPRHVLVVLYSQLVQAATVHLVPREPDNSAPPPRLPVFEQTFQMNAGAFPVTFNVQKKDLVSPEELQSLCGILGILNTLIPDKPIHTVNIGRTLWSEFSQQTIQVGLRNKDELKQIVTHEAGHIIYETLFNDVPSPVPRDTDNWLSVLYLLGLNDQNFEIIDDSNYMTADDDSGHPDSNPSELFASSLVTYVLNPERMLKFIDDKDTPASLKLFGRLMFSFLRENIFKGRTFLPEGASPSWSWLSERQLIPDKAVAAHTLYLIRSLYPLGEFRDREILKSLIYALGNLPKDHHLRSEPALQQLLLEILQAPKANELGKNEALLTVDKLQIPPDKETMNVLVGLLTGEQQKSAYLEHVEFLLNVYLFLHERSSLLTPAAASGIEQQSEKVIGRWLTVAEGEVNYLTFPKKKHLADMLKKVKAIVLPPGQKGISDKENIRQDLFLRIDALLSRISL